MCQNTALLATLYNSSLLSATLSNFSISFLNRKKDIGSILKL
jgi:hypothetical protein